MNNTYILLSMIFLHIVDDYILQGKLANFKQKQWWIDNYPNKLYKYDYITALIVHSFSWTFMIMLPIMLLIQLNNEKFIIIFICNIATHAIIDDLKANKLKINLTIDQLIHLIQIIITWILIGVQ